MQNTKEKIIFHFVIELIQWKFNFLSPVVKNVRKFLSLASFNISTHVCLFNFVLCQSFLFVRLFSLLPLETCQFPSKHFFLPSSYSCKVSQNVFFCCDDTAMVLYWQIILTMLNGKWNWVNKMIVSQAGENERLRCELMCVVMKNNVKNHHFLPLKNHLISAEDFETLEGRENISEELSTAFLPSSNGFDKRRRGIELLN